MTEELNLSNIFSIATAFIALMLNGILALSIHFGAHRRTLVTRCSLLLFSSVFLFSCASIAENVLNGRPGDGVLLPLRVACFCDYLFAGLLTFTFSGLLLAFADPRREYVHLRELLTALMALMTLQLILGQSFGWFYTIDENNQAQRGPLFYLSVLFPALMLLLDGYVLAFRAQRLSRGDRVVFWSVIGIMTVSAVLQLFFRNVIPVAILLVALLLHVFLAGKQLQMLHRELEKNLRLQNEILLSELQPHFMYNTLAAIADLCDNDAPRAKQTILLFSRYLQGIVRSLNSRQTVPFAEELTHVQRYLELSQIRFEDALRVEYEIECDAFLLPPMCLQPLVENAVRHGVRKNPGGRGTVSLRTVEAQDCWKIIVSDDGPGLDQKTKPDREHIQVGLKNVEDRLRLLCGGSLELASEPGKGTAVTIRIPRNQEGQSC